MIITARNRLRVVHAVFNPEAYESKGVKMASSPQDSGH